jgi:HK97 family phage portal protein
MNPFQSVKTFFVNLFGGSETAKPLSPIGNGLFSNDSGIKLSENTALSHMAFYRCVNLLAGSIATQPKHLFERTDSDGIRGKTIRRDHPAARLVGNPNDFQNSYQFHFFLVTYLLLYGNFYGFIQRNRFYQPVAIIPLAPWEVLVAAEGGQKVFKYRGNTYSNDQILHIYGMSLDSLKGVNPIKYAAQSIGLGLAAEKMQASAFGKGLHAGGVVKMPEEMNGMLASTDEETEQYMEGMRDSFKKLYQNGPESWHEIMFLEPGWNFEQFKLNFETAQMIETRKFEVADIARLMGIPLHKLMELDKATYNNIEQQGIEFVQDGVMPLAVNIESEYNEKLLRPTERGNHFFKINLDGLMRADIKSRYEAYSIALGKNAPGFMSPGEIRELEDLGDIDESDLFKPDNMNKQSDKGES